MSIQLYIGHTGQRISLDPNITTLEALKSWIESKTAIIPRSQILLTAQGKQVRAQTLLTENELFIFDSKLFTSPDTILPQNDAADKLFRPGNPPDTISSQNDLQAWQDLFIERKSWATTVLTGCSKLADQAEAYLDEEYIIARSVGVAVASLQQHVKSGEKKYKTVATWLEEVLQEQEAQLQGWEQNLDALRNIPARSEFARFVHITSVASRRLSQQGTITTLQGFVDVAKIKRAAGAASRVSSDLSDRLAKLQNKLNLSTKECDELQVAVQQFQSSTRSDSESEPIQLRKEIELIVRKMTSDLEHISALPRTAQSVSQVSKMALLHTRNYLPNLKDYCTEMNELIQRAHQKRTQAGAAALSHMRMLSAIESRLAELYADTTSFGLTDEHQQDIAALSTVPRLPLVYGQLLVESVRRREWVAKMKRDSAVLQEEMATYQEEEEKRRRKWIRSVEDVVNSDAIESSRALGIELSLQNEGGSWPMVTRSELTDYLTVLQSHSTAGVVEEMDLAIKDLDKPTRKQIKRAKAFKNGSMHETAFGDTSLMLRGEEQHKALRDANQRLEEDLKASKSRVRKLEDLVHRSTQASRSADLFNPRSTGDRAVTPPYLPSSQLSGELSPSSSNRHRRLSSNLGIEEKKLARRVVDLEAELQTFREEAASRKNSDVDAQRQIEEANSTKKDLMENMEAQQREFSTERRNLELELREAKEKLEEVEAEIERIIGSRDDERSGLGARVAGMDADIARLREDAAGHAARAATAQDARNAIERKLRVAEATRATTEEQMQRIRLEQELMREAQTDQVERLASAHSHLAPDEPVPNTVAGISIALDELSRKSFSHIKDLTDAIAFARAENDSFRTQIDAQRAEIISANQRRLDTEDEARQARERLAVEEAKAVALEEQLNDEKQQLRSLRNKFADGETGSEVLRQRVAEEEQRAGTLSSQLAEATSHINSLNDEMSRLQKSAKDLQGQVDASNARQDSRATRARDVSHRLYAHNARLTRLLERLGLAISYQDDVMSIERASKLNASTTMDNSLSRTTSRTSPPPTRKSSGGEDSFDLTMLRWASAQSSEDETTQFDAFAQHLSKFNIDTFADAVVKRVRDFEYTAKKYSRESKESTKRADAYKDKSIKLRAEAYHKLAVKDFKEGDLALFLPTRGQANGAWAAFNIGCPHYFLAEREGMRLGSRDFIVARISKVEQKVVDLSKSAPADDASEAPSVDDDNPFDLSDGLTWWMVHATEERNAGAAPTTPGLSKSTVAAANVDARGSIRMKRSSKADDASKHLNKSLDSRRSSSNSKKSVAGAIVPTIAGSPAGDALASRQRSESQASQLPPTGLDGAVPRSGSQNSLRPSPAVVGPGGISSGLGIVESASQLDDAQPMHDQVSKLSRPDVERAKSDLTPTKTRLRSTSPSKSIRSLRQHLEPVSPAKSKGWDNLFSADITLTSPTKGNKV
ncbi:hypothetical protein AMS68_000601 [Peltaster fructicola]|uniref:Autophagy-related protein 11 n=1 Tax=Peltaster fructicola TaxID=286661 RepID=A0A6H0XK31_9PEZI|nr:hypothetical protein AMS68_000601 [Peltaster fructicola]